MNRIVLDIETTGLDPNRHRILEVAMVLCTEDGESLADRQVLVRQNLDPEFLIRDHNTAKDADFLMNMHTQNGLLSECRRSFWGVSACEGELLDTLRSWNFERGDAITIGNTVQFDRAFLKRWMPDLDAFLSYRIIDLSSITRLVSKKFEKPVSNHRALDDCYRSLEEYRHYLRVIRAGEEALDRAGT